MTSLAITIVVTAAIVALVFIALRQFGITVPDWVIQVFWVLVVAIVVITAIRIIAGLPL